MQSSDSSRLYPERVGDSSDNPAVEDAARLLNRVTDSDLGVVPIEHQPACILKAVQTVLEAAQGNRLSSDKSETPEKLNKRPYEVLKLRHLGKSTAEIQRELWITEATVRSHDRTINAFYGTRKYSEAVEKARSRGDV